jgi:WD40-like Beta Propeller Repeat
VKFRLVGLALTAFASAALAGEAHASFPGENGRLVFSWQHEVSEVTTDELATVNSAGTRFRVIVGCGYGCHYTGGDWSPSGGRVVYAHDFDAQERVGTVRPAGGDRKVVYRGVVSSPVWSPDADRIAFAKWRWSDRVGNWMSNIFVIDRDGTHLTKLTRTRPSERDLDWSTRNRLVFVRRGDLFTMRPNGRKLRRLTHTDARESQPDWAPGGGRLTFVRDGEIWKMRASGQNATMIASGHSPTWAPDGTLIAFISAADGAIHTVKPSGKDDTFLSSPRPEIFHLDWQPR